MTWAHNFFGKLNPHKPNTPPTMTPPNPRQTNGHRRRQLKAHLTARDTHCGICHHPLHPHLTTLPGHHGPKCNTPTCPGCTPHPLKTEIDEIIPISKGGSPLDPQNTHLTHRQCNQQKSNHTLTQAQQKQTHQPPPNPTQTPPPKAQTLIPE